MSRQNSETKSQSGFSTYPPQITIENTIEEEEQDDFEHGDDDDTNNKYVSNAQISVLSVESQETKPDDNKIPTRRVSEFRPRFYLPKPYRKFSLTDKGSMNPM